MRPCFVAISSPRETITGSVGAPSQPPVVRVRVRVRVMIRIRVRVRVKVRVRNRVPLTGTL